MGVVRAAVGLDEQEDMGRTLKPSIAPAITASTTTTTTAKPTDSPDTQYYSGLLVVQASLIFVFGCYVLATIVIKLCRRKYWLGDTAYLVREYFFKLGTFHLFLCGFCFTIYYLSYKRAGYEETTCFYFWHHKWLLIFILPMTVFVYALRYMAFGLASSDSFKNKGIEMPNPRVRHDIRQGWTADTANYKRVLGNFYTFTMLTVGLILIIMFVVVTKEQRASLMNISLCTPALQDSLIDRFIFVILLIFCPNFSAILAEFILRERTDMEVFGVTLNTPFVTTTAATTWLSWFSLVFYLYYFIGAFAGQYVLLLCYLLTVDMMWYVMLCVLAASTRTV